MDVFDNRFESIPEAMLHDPVLTKAEIKELQRAIFDQDLISALNVVNGESVISEEQNVHHVRGENRTYFIAEEGKY